MKEGFTFNWASVKFLWIFAYKNFGGGEQKEPKLSETLDELRRVQLVYISIFQVETLVWIGSEKVYVGKKIYWSLNLTIKINESVGSAELVP